MIIIFALLTTGCTSQKKAPSSKRIPASYAIDNNTYENQSIKLEKFDNPFCMIGHGKPELSFKKKLKILKRYQRKISRKTKDFFKNKKKESKSKLFGSPKWVAIRYLRARNYSWAEVDFAFFAMTLFGEARNLDDEDIEMVARVINNRRKTQNYRETVTRLAQFSAWYYKNQWDNVTLLCPSKSHQKNWKRVVQIAKKHFYEKDELLGSKHYFAPHNMRPKYKVPVWAKGKYAARFGGHIFVFNDKTQTNINKDQLFFIPKGANRLRIRKGEVQF